MFIDELVQSNPFAWFIILCAVAVVLVLAIKFRFWLIILKLLVVMLALIIVYYLVIPFLYDYLFDPPFIVEWFWKITPNIWDDFYNIIDFLSVIGLGLLSIILIKVAIKGKKRADSTKQAKVRVEVN